MVRDEQYLKERKAALEMRGGLGGGVDSEVEGPIKSQFSYR